MGHDLNTERGLSRGIFCEKFSVDMKMIVCGRARAREQGICSRGRPTA